MKRLNPLLKDLKIEKIRSILERRIRKKFGADTGNGYITTYSVKKEEQKRPPDLYSYLFDLKCFF